MSSHKEIIFCWIPSHIKVSGNEKADSAAKLALDLSPEIISIPYTDLKPTISKFLYTKWRQWWTITSIINSFKFSPPWENRDQLLENQEENKSLYPDCALVIQGLLTLSYWNRNHNHNIWPVKQLARLNILIECRAFAVIWKRFFKVNSLTDLFENVKIDDVQSFLRETGLY